MFELLRSYIRTDIRQFLQFGRPWYVGRLSGFGVEGHAAIRLNTPPLGIRPGVLCLPLVLSSSSLIVMPFGAVPS